MSSSQQYANVYVNIHMSGVHCGSAVRFGQALPGFLITAPPSVCVSTVLGALGVWIQNQKKTRNEQVVTGHSHERPCSRSWHRRTSHDTGLRHVRYPCPGACTAYPPFVCVCFASICAYLALVCAFVSLFVRKRMPRRREHMLRCHCMRWSMQPAAYVGVPCACARFVGAFVHACRFCQAC